MDGETIARRAREHRGKAAVIMGGSGESRAFAQLDANSNRAAHLFRARGLTAGDAVAYCLPNCAAIFDIAFAGLRAGLVIVPVAATLTRSEIEYIAEDSGAKLLILSAEAALAFGDAADASNILVVGADRSSAQSWEAACLCQPETPIPDESRGSTMFYSSGTTGRPKGIRWTIDSNRPSSMSRFGITHESIYLSPAPLYHTAPLVWALGIISMGGTVIVMEKFDAENALALIERYRVNLSQWVPTHFVRLLKLDAGIREKYDVSSLKQVVHGAAPCPIPVKHAMIDWFGPIITEYFGSTEQTTMTVITAQEWLERPGSVGKCPLGTIHICDDDGRPLPRGEIGTIYSESGQKFTYLNDPGKTAGAMNALGWTSVGDIGYLDEEGYLFLTDRKGFMIITGGVNVYPQEIENLLVTHPRVADAAVIGTPDPEMGERVTAIIQPMDMADANAEFAAELRRWMRLSLSGVKVPKRIEFEENLPRLPTGKMQKFILRDRYSNEIAAGEG